MWSKLCLNSCQWLTSLKLSDGGNEVTYRGSIIFVAGTGASELLVKSRLVLTYFKQSEWFCMKSWSVNKERSADLKLNDQSDLLPVSNTDRRTKLVFTNVMEISDLSRNLVSLRHFADEGLGICLDDEVRKVFDGVTSEMIVRGKYKRHEKKKKNVRNIDSHNEKDEWTQ